LKLLSPSLLVCAALALSACGGSGGSGDGSPLQPGNPNPPGQNPPPQEPPSQPPPPNTDPYVIEYHGDSTIWGWETGTSGARVGTPAPTAFANALPSTPQNEVRNLGINGSTACGLLEGANGQETWATKMAESNATHVILNHGINDSSNGAVGYDVPRYRSCLTQLAAIARANGKEVVFETPNPIAGSRMDDYVVAMRSVAATQQPAIPVIDQHQYLTDFLAGRDVHEIVPDGAHPSQQTYIMKGEYAAQRFMAIFPR